MFDDVGGLILLGLTIILGVTAGWIAGTASNARDRSKRETDPFQDRDHWGV